MVPSLIICKKSKLADSMSRPGFYFCICPDAGLLKNHIEQLQGDFPADVCGSVDGAAGGLMGGSLLSGADIPKPEWERHIYWGDEDLSPAFWEHLMLQGLFSKPRLLIVRNAHSIAAARWKELSAALAQPNPLTWLILCLEGAWEKGQPKLPAHIAKQKSLAFADKKGWIWRHCGLDIQGIKKYIQSKAQFLDLTFEPQVFDALCACVPPDALAIDSELEKLHLAAIDGRVSMDMVGSGTFIPESNIFSFMNQIYAGNVSSAWREIYRSQNDLDALLFPFLALLARDAKTLWQILAGENPRMHPAAAREKELCARRLGFHGIAQIFACIVQAELAIKSGERSVEQTLEAIVTELCMLFRPARRG